jgi:hypothetical protein
MINRINFNWITIKNFFSVGGELKFDFSTHSGMNYVFGTNKDLDVKNGCGKSVIFCDAILFGLFGKTSKNVNKNNIINRLVGVEAEVQLNFTIENNEYLIINSIRPTQIKLFKNGEEITKSSIKETQDYIIKEIIKTSFEIFKNSIILSVNDTPNVFLMSKGEKRNFIEQLFNFTILGEIFYKMKCDKNTFERELISERSNFNKLEESLKEFKNKHEAFGIEKNTKIKNIEKLIKEKESQKNKILANIEITKLDASILKIQDEILKMEENFRIAGENLRNFDNDIKLNSRDIQNENNSIKRYANIIDTVCEDCNEKLDTLLGISESEEKIKSGNTKIEDLKQKSNEKNSEIKVLRKQIPDLKTKLTKLQHAKDEKIKESHLDEHIKILMDRLDEEKNTISPFDTFINSYSEKLLISKNKMNEIIETNGYLDFLIYTLSEEGVKKYLVSELINILNSRIRGYLEEMGCEYTAIFDPNFDCTFLTTTGECEYANFSAGERRRIDISTIFAFRDLLFGQGTLQSNILVCDEILDISIDEFCINSIIKLLKKEAEKQIVFTVSHRECLDKESDFDNVIELKKEGGYTSIISDPQGEIEND